MKLVNKVRLVTILLFFLTSFGFQAISSESAVLDSVCKFGKSSIHIRNIIWNILTYRIYEYLSQDYVKENGIQMYDIEAISKLFPPDSCTFDFSIEKIEKLTFPDTNYEIFDFYFDIKKYSCSKSHKYITIFSSVGYSYDCHHLIAVNQNSAIGKPDLVYISGNYFINNISSFYTFNNDDPKSFIDYIKLNAFKFGFDKIDFLRRKNKKFIYSGTDSWGREILITLSVKNDYEISYKCKNCIITIPEYQPLKFKSCYLKY
jgi:hypothetical protein